MVRGRAGRRAAALLAAASTPGCDHALLGSIDNSLARRAGQYGLLVARFPALFCTAAPIPGLRPVRYWACYDARGSLRRASPLALASTAFLDSGIFGRAIRQGDSFGAIDAGGDVGQVRWYARTIVNPATGRALGVLELGTEIQGQVNALHTLLILLVAIGAVALLCATIGGLILADRALAPARLAFARQQAFIADASHELRTPLTLLRADAEVLLRGRNRLPEEDAELLDDIVSEAAHMATLAGNMLSLARLDAGGRDVERTPLDLSDVAAGVARRAEALCAEMGIALQIDAQETVPVLANRTLLEQATLILIDNAVKYNRPSGSVQVRVGTSEPHAILEVRDTGIGIPAEHLPHLGERFYRVDKARSREAGGAGLGLSIARGIASAHGGTLTFISLVGYGTTATLALPLARTGVGAAHENVHI